MSQFYNIHFVEYQRFVESYIYLFILVRALQLCMSCTYYISSLLNLFLLSFGGRSRLHIRSTCIGFRLWGKCRKSTLGIAGYSHSPYEMPSRFTALPPISSIIGTFPTWHRLVQRGQYFLPRNTDALPGFEPEPAAWQTFVFTTWPTDQLRRILYKISSFFTIIIL